MKLRSYSATNAGRVRQNNEDEIFADDELGIYCVIDGMGGHAAGEQAAAIAKDELRGRLSRAIGSVDERVREAIVLANNKILECASTNPDWHGMACVLTAAVVDGDELVVGHVGDSRLYLLQNGEMLKITRDHSPVGVLEDGQELSEAEAMAHPRRNEVYRDVGTTEHDTEDENFIDLYRVPLTEDAAILLCSDGLTDALASKEIRGVIEQKAGNPRAVVEELIARAVRIGKDNVSVVYAEAPQFAFADGDITAPNETVQEHVTRRRRIWPAILISFAVGFAVAWAAMHYQDWLPAHPAAAHVIQVDPQGQNGAPSIKAALEQAQAGDSIQLGAGTYRELVVVDKSVTISGAAATILPPDDTTPANAVTVGAHADVKLVNLSISGTNLLEGVSVEGGRVTLEKVTISGAQRAGIEVGAGGAATVEYSSIHDNPGPGAWIRSGASAIFRFNNIAGNGHGTANKSPGLEIESDRPVEIVGNTFGDNAAGPIRDIHPISKQVLAGNLFQKSEVK